MGKKHGGIFAGYRPQLSSLASSFARRGNPMMTEKEAVRLFGRNLETENPDFDADKQRYDKTVGASLDLSKRTLEELELSEKQVRDTFPESPFKRKAWHQKTEVIVEVKKRRDMTALIKSVNKRRAFRAEMKAFEPIDIKDRNRQQDDVQPDNIKATVFETSKEPSREKQTPVDLRGHRGFYDFSGKMPPKEKKKNGKIYRRK